MGRLRITFLGLFLAGCHGKGDSGPESAPPAETAESGAADTRESDPAETDPLETGARETGPDTGDSAPTRRWVCGVDGIPADGAPLGFVSLGEAEARSDDYGGDAAAGDQDGDGCSDVLLGYVMFTGPILGEVDAHEDGSAYLEGQQGDYAVYPAAGDIDGDGLSDWVIGGEGIAGDLGGAYVVFGPTYGTVDLWSEADAILLGQGDQSGGRDNHVADLDTDGFGDLILVAYAYGPQDGWPGAVYLQNGPVSGTTSLAGAEGIIEGVTTSGYRGPTNTSGGGDLDGDGVVDLSLGSPAAMTTGVAYVFCHQAVGLVRVTDADAILVGESNSYAGWDLSSGGDVDGDGYGDLLVGAPEYGDMRGRAYLVHGPVQGEHSLGQADAIVWAPGFSAEVGKSVSLEQDMDGDGRSDVAIGSPGADGARHKGAVFVFYEPFKGTVNAFDEAWAVLYTEEEEVFPSTGYCMASAGDVNGDGYGDLHVGTWPDYLVFGGPR